MGRVCVVKNCDSGSQQDIRQRIKDGVRKSTFFKIPTDDAIRKEWGTILPKELKNGDRVCDIHFRYEDLFFNDEFLEINGESVHFPRGTITRKPGSKPQLMIFSDEERLECKENNRHKVLQKKNDVKFPQNHKKLNNRRKVLQEKNDVNFSQNHKKENNRRKVLQEKNDVIFPQNHNKGEELMQVDDVGNQVDRMDIVEETPSIEALANNIKKIDARAGWTWIQKEDNILFAFVDFNSHVIRCYVEIRADMTVTALSCNRQKLIGFRHTKSIKNVQELNELQQQLESQKWCLGVGIFHQSHSVTCTGIAKKILSCLNCTKERKRLRLKSKKQRKNRFRFNKIDDKPLASTGLKLLRQKCNYKKVKLLEARIQIVDLEQQLENLKSNRKEDLLEGLPLVQREIVEMFFTFKKIDSNRYRYSSEWICECFIMHTKSTALYEYIRERGILPLCSSTTLNTAIGNMQAAYGFQKAVFDSMKIKAASLPEHSKQGILLADEVSMSKAVGLDKNWMIRGFTDFGSYTPTNLEKNLADHALVLIFCPFRGQWTQPIAAFASTKLTSEVLDKILLEALRQIESTGFQVDAIGMDGAQVNRKVWNSHSVDGKNISCVHPIDNSRRLWFMSDGSHLWKNWRTHVLKLAEFWTPDGIVKKKHWELLLVYENYLKYNLKIAYKLTPDHIHPKGFQTMNVLMATQVFDDSISLAMQMCMKNPKCPGMADAQPTITFIKKVRGAIDAMTSRIPCNALKVDENCHNRKASEFIFFLEDWKKQAKEGNYVFPFPNNTYVGFVVTLKGTLEILDSLHKRHNYSFLMTCRLLSDPIERFFGILKTAAGCNSKPDPIIFIHLFKIFCCFDLIKSPKGSNVGKREVLKVLASTKNSMASQVSNKTLLVEKLKLWIEQCDRQQVSETTTQSVHPVREHTYDVVNTDDIVISDVSGWAVRRLIEHTKCEECKQSFQSSSNTAARHELTNAKEQFGGLIRSSDSVYNLLKQLEDAATTLLGTEEVTKRLMENLVNDIVKLEPASLVGCKTHEKLATTQLVTFFLDRRGIFACNTFNKINNADKTKEKQFRKNSSLV